MSKIFNFFLAAFVGFCIVYLILNYKSIRFGDGQVNVTPQEKVAEKVNIIVDYPQPNDIVTSPLVVKGKARGGWWFEANFPIVLYYGVQDEFVETYVSTDKEWMTDEFIDFEVTIEFPEPYAKDGTLELQKSNPSDIKELNDSLIIPVRFF